MTVSFDFLPASFHERRQQKNAGRHRVLLFALLIAGVVVTEVGFRRRIAAIEKRKQLVGNRADIAEQLAFQYDTTATRKQRLLEELDQATAALQSPYAGAALDEILRHRPDSILFEHLEWRHDLWSLDEPSLTMQAVCLDYAELKSFLAALDNSDTLPTLEVKNSSPQHSPTGSSRSSFQLAPPASDAVEENP